MVKDTSYHIGNDQFVYGMPKRMSGFIELSSNKGGQSGETGPPKDYDTRFYWRIIPKPKACDKCQAMKKLWFEKKPNPVHPNCKCQIKKFKTIKPRGSDNFIIVPEWVDIEANLAEARMMKNKCETNPFPTVDSMIGNTLPIYVVSKEIIIRFRKCDWIYKNFHHNARYDYKKYGDEYESFGNYHYGLYTKAIGLEETIAQIGAGYAQFKSGNFVIENLKHYGDDKRDQDRIKDGFKDVPFFPLRD